MSANSNGALTDAEIEASAQSIHRHFPRKYLDEFGFTCTALWGDLEPHMRDEYRIVARAALATAGLPTTRAEVLEGKAEAWDEGYEAGETDGYLIGRDEPFDETTNNPYRTERGNV